jgi:hypothetical protein
LWSEELVQKKAFMAFHPERVIEVWEGYFAIHQLIFRNNAEQRISESFYTPLFPLERTILRAYFTSVCRYSILYEYVAGRHA